MRKTIYPKYRNCPECGKEVSAYRIAFIENRKCRECSIKNWSKMPIGWKKKTSKYININPPYIKKCPKCNSEMIYDNKYTFIYSILGNKCCNNCANAGKNSGIKRIPYKRTAETKIKNRIAMINTLSKNYFNGGQAFPNFNPDACEIIEQYGKKNGYNFQHAMNGGEYYIKELGYWVDGYDTENNVVLECYEKHHFRDGKIQDKDINRQEEIINHLNCKFIIYDFRKGDFKNVTE